MKGVHLWLVPDPSIATTVLAEHAESVLSSEELTRCQSHRLPKGQRVFLLTRIVLRELLSHHYPDIQPTQWIFSRSANGKPIVGNPNLNISFNLSHAGSMIALAFAENVSIGVDIEHCEREVDVDGLSGRFFSEAEHKLLMSLPVPARQQRFLTLWTMKEAVVKASGLGLAKALRDYEFIIDEATGHLDFRQSHGRISEQGGPRWEVCAAMSGDYHVALAMSPTDDTSLHSDLTVRWFRWPDRIDCREVDMFYTAKLSD
ncbi:4'-phosphopantetheinyl transferase family protein [Pseudohongiella spirulinae]|uniref:Uncharacterized protein n=1 Tax=Pseudohongiella spirulinae TaxID=1249552 RepID=A0A0S2KC62_9GAMM|nr:4'-phosphopantetheinyl transferase superfamily protein [Pseudohongiella spirulinae]ALO45898.1 hypothetical protein PS2015_1239 [Pseudohongiella spirulinae]